MMVNIIVQLRIFQFGWNFMMVYACWSLMIFFEGQCHGVWVVMVDFE